MNGVKRNEINMLEHDTFFLSHFGKLLGISARRNYLTFTVKHG